LHSKIQDKKKQAYKPGSVTETGSAPYHLSRRSVAETLYLPTLLYRAGTLKHRFTWHFTA